LHCCATRYEITAKKTIARDFSLFASPLACTRAARAHEARARVSHMPRRAKTIDADVELPPSRRHSKGVQQQRPGAAANKPPNRRSGGQTGQRTSQHAPSVPRQEASSSDYSDGTHEESLPRQAPGQRASTHPRRGGRNGQRTGQHASSVRQTGSSSESSDESDEEASSPRSGGQHRQRTAKPASSVPRQEASSSEATDEEWPSNRRNVGLLGVSSDGLWQSTGQRAPSVPRQEAASSSESSEEIDEESQSPQARGQCASTVWTDLGISLGLGAQPARGASKTKPPRRAWTAHGSSTRSLAFEKLAPASEAQATRSTIADGGRFMRRCLQAWLAASAVAQVRCVAVLLLAAYALVRSQTHVPESLRGFIVYTWS